MIHFLMSKFLLRTEQKFLLSLNLGKQCNNNESYKTDIYRKYVCFFIFQVCLATLSILIVLYSISCTGQLRNLFISMGEMCLCACAANSLYLCSFCLWNGLHRHHHRELWLGVLSAHQNQSLAQGFENEFAPVSSSNSYCF